MRKHIKEQLLELYKTIIAGVDYVVSTTENKEQAQNILIDCYSGFTYIKEAAENGLNKDRFSTYAECIDKIRNNMEIFNDCIQDDSDYTEILNMLNINLKVFEEMLANEKIKLEVVFLPYKVSMWDSLESVWKAANEDEDCDAYVIPIPYYDRNPNGTFGEMHYEGDLYPDYVPITHYNSYNFEVRRPDIVYIHSPYDDGNLVTSVHPFFYSKNIKKFTDKLVYIPYFVLHNIKSDNKKEIDKIKHFISTSAVIYADKVIVQSEEMKKIYVNEYVKLCNEMGLDCKYQRFRFTNSKFLGIGSPKIDKLFNTESQELSKEWKEKIFKNNKKKLVLFFNTNISLMLNNGDKFIDNLNRIEKIFKKYSDKITIIWREHPLTNETLKSMRPQLINDYLKFKKNFLLNDWVILDNNTEWNTAANISDCYYGASGSLCALYLLTKKPILITDYKFPNGIKNIDVSLDIFKSTMNYKCYYNEKFKNSLDLFISENKELSIFQKEKLDTLPTYNKNTSIGKVIYYACK